MGELWTQASGSQQLLAVDYKQPVAERTICKWFLPFKKAGTVAGKVIMEFAGPFVKGRILKVNEVPLLRRETAPIIIDGSS